MFFDTKKLLHLVLPTPLKNQINPNNSLVNFQVEGLENN